MRKLALDLNGLAGFAILDQDGDVANTSGGTTASTGGAPISSAETRTSSILWRNGSSAGQVLTARGPSLGVDATSIRKAVSGQPRIGEGVGRTHMSSWVAQQEPAAPADPNVPGSVEPVAPDPAAPGTLEPGNAAEQAGLLKITDDGQVVPALVALEEAPLDEPVTGDAGAPPSAGPSGGFAGAAPSAAPTGQAPAPGAGGATSPGNVGPSPGPRYEPLPRVTAVGLSPDGSVYILFERSFFYRQPPAEDLVAGFDPFAQGSPYRCQLFRAGNWQNPNRTVAPPAELECVTSDYEIRTWDARRVMQFDATGKLYFRAAAPGTPKEVFYQYDPVSKALSEKVNGNICWRDVQVTPRGSLFYTGTNGTAGDCSGTSFFRYVSEDNRLTEIARDWWNFKYLAEQDPEDPTNERIIFYGPDPNSSSGSAWETACLYRYNPATADPAARSQKLVECVSNPMSYIYGNANGGPSPVSPEDLPAFGERCESEGQLFVGGEGVTGLSQLQDGTLFVVGKFQKKLAGEVRCGLNVNVDHCVSLDPEHATREACETAGQEWLRSQPYCTNSAYDNAPDCYANSGDWQPGVGFRSYQKTGASCLIVRAGFERQNLDCGTPGQPQNGSQFNLSQEVTGLAYLVPSTDGGLSELRLLSDPTEEVERYWALDSDSGPELYYSVYSAGQYNLRLVTQTENTEGDTEVQRRLILSDYEVYNLQRDPANSSRVMFDALQFSTNNYLFGSADTTLATPEAVQASVQAVAGVSGRVETLIVLPNF